MRFSQRINALCLKTMYCLLNILKDNAIIYVLIAWVVTIVTAKALKLQNHGFELKPYSLVYKNANVQGALDKILIRTRRGIRVFADVSVIAGFLMMGFVSNSAPSASANI